MAGEFPGALVGPSSKERKYDRQLRLWAASGQQALEAAQVLLVNSDGPWGGSQGAGGSGVVGVETLKNLVLPGIGGFTIVDPATVTETDLGVNFFLEEESLGKSRAEETCRLLMELNPDVQGSFETKPVAELLKDAEFLAQYKLVLISGPLRRSSLDAICKGARELDIPVLYIHSVGFYSTFSLQLPAEFPIVETHPDPETTQDLRLVDPWPELAAAASQVGDFSSMDDHQHGHIPYVTILMRCLEKWKKSHNGNGPSNYQEKLEFRKGVLEYERTNNPEGGEENFGEAAAAVLKSVNPFALRSTLREIFEMDECKNLKPESADFWVIASALNEFYQKHQVLPLPGSLPDMKALSEDYVALQSLYKAKAKKDVEEVTEIVRRIESHLGSRPAPIPEKEIEVFCKNAAHVKVVRGRDIPQLDDAYTQKTVRSNLGFTGLAESIMPIFIAFQILDSIVTDIQEGNQTGGSIDDETSWKTHIDRVLSLLRQEDPTAVDEHKEQSIVDATRELRRTEGGELHNTSALVGGLVSQEALKVITRQYVPLDNTCIFDGVHSRTEMYRL